MSDQALLTLRQLFAACHDFVDLLGREAVLALALVSREVWNLARGLIEQRYWFWVRADEQRFGGSEPIRFRHYAPRRFRLVNIDEDAKMFVVPESVVSLQMYFGMCWFGSPVDHLPASVTRLRLGNFFDQAVDALPPSITRLTFGYRFNQPVDHLPPGVSRLSFGHDFNQRVDRLPPGVTHLKLGRRFNGPLDALPSGVTHLALDCLFQGSLNQLPRHVEFLAFLTAYGSGWKEIERRPNVVWFESGQTLSGEQLSRRTSDTVFRWKKPAPPLAKRKRDEDDGEPSAKRA